MLQVKLKEKKEVAMLTIIGTGALIVAVSVGYIRLAISQIRS